MKRLLIVLLLSGCSVTYNAPVTEPKEPAEKQIAMCNKLQESDLPIACKYSYVQGKPVMRIVFQNLEQMGKLSDIIDGRLVTPYCEEMTSNGIKAFAVFSLYDERLWSMGSCVNGEISEWYSIDD